MRLYKQTKNTNFSNCYNFIFVVGDELGSDLTHQVAPPPPSIAHRFAGIDRHFHRQGVTHPLKGYVIQSRYRGDWLGSALTLLPIHPLIDSLDPHNHASYENST